MDPLDQQFGVLRSTEGEQCFDVLITFGRRESQFGARSREGGMWDFTHKVGEGLKIEFPGDGNEAKGDGKGAGNEFEIARMVGEGLRLGKIMVV